MQKRLSSPITALRRQRTLFGLVLAWLLACQTLLGGLALARVVPDQYAAALTGQSLCQPGESGAPAQGDQVHSACQICPHNASGTALTPAHPAIAVFSIPLLQDGAQGVWPAPITASSKPDVRSSGPRAPPSRG